MITLDRRQKQSEADHRVTPMSPLQRWLHFSTKKVIGGGRLAIIGFQFLHADMTHLFFNMVALFFDHYERFLEASDTSPSICCAASSVPYLFLNMAVVTISYGCRLEVSCSMPQAFR